jgi:iron(III) transport system permease protein
LLIFPLLLLGAPLSGLIKPLHSEGLRRAMEYPWQALVETGGTTAWYALTAGAMGTTLGIMLAMLCGRTAVFRRGAILFGFIFIALAPSLHALGLVVLGSSSPPYLDAVTRSGWIVGIGMGLCLAPVATMFALVSLAKIPRSMNYAAAVHGLPVVTYLRRVLLPRLLPSILVSLTVISLLAMADVSSTLLLAPPGETTYAGRIFSVMDNASERLVAALCLGYLVFAGLPVLLLFWLGTGRPRGKAVPC